MPTWVSTFKHWIIVSLIWSWIEKHWVSTTVIVVEIWQRVAILSFPSTINQTLKYGNPKVLASNTPFYYVLYSTLLLPNIVLNLLFSRNVHIRDESPRPISPCWLSHSQPFSRTWNYYKFNEISLNPLIDEINSSRQHRLPTNLVDTLTYCTLSTLLNHTTTIPWTKIIPRLETGALDRT